VKLDGIARFVARRGLPGDLGREGGGRLSHVFFQRPFEKLKSTLALAEKWLSAVMIAPIRAFCNIY
jgi:hypothetical protein